MKTAFAIASILLLVQTMPARAQFFDTGSELLEYCSAGKRTPPMAYCLGVVSTIADSYEGDRSQDFCFSLPQGTTQNQLAAVVKKWLDQNPENLHMPAALLVQYAFFEAFPC